MFLLYVDWCCVCYSSKRPALMAAICKINLTALYSRFQTTCFREMLWCNKMSRTFAAGAVYLKNYLLNDLARWFFLTHLPYFIMSFRFFTWNRPQSILPLVGYLVLHNTRRAEARASTRRRKSMRLGGFVAALRCALCNKVTKFPGLLAFMVTFRIKLLLSVRWERVAYNAI